MSICKIVLSSAKSGGTTKGIRTLCCSESPVSISHSISLKIQEPAAISILENNWWNNIKNYLKCFKTKFSKTTAEIPVTANNFNREEAVQLNKIAVRQAKLGKVERVYPQASPHDLKRLTSETIEDSFLRVEWTNPKDGKIYNLLKQGETKDGNILIRILDEEGAFIKEAQIKPKQIAILDTFGTDKLRHGDKVMIYAKRHNPFAIYTKIEDNDIGGKDAVYACINALKNNHYDYVNFSSGKAIRIHDVTKVLKQLSSKELSKIGISRNMQKNLQAGKVKIEDLRNYYIKALQEYPQLKSLEDELVLHLDSLCANNTRVLVACGNNYWGQVNRYLYTGKNLEGVASLSTNGRLSEFSSSRRKGYIKHCEVGEYRIQETPFGYNFTDINGTDTVKTNLPDDYVGGKSNGTSFATPIRTAKLALNDMMEGIL